MYTCVCVILCTIMYIIAYMIYVSYDYSTSLPFSPYLHM